MERNKNEIILRLPKNFDKVGLKRILNYLEYKKVIKKSKATTTEINKLANESKTNWWAENKNKFIK